MMFGGPGSGTSKRRQQNPIVRPSIIPNVIFSMCLYASNSLVYQFNECGRRHERSTPPRVVSNSRLCGNHILGRPALLLESSNSIAHIHQHVPKKDQVCFAADGAMTTDDNRGASDV